MLQIETANWAVSDEYLWEQLERSSYLFRTMVSVEASNRYFTLYHEAIKALRKRGWAIPEDGDHQYGELVNI